MERGDMFLVTGRLLVSFGILNLISGMIAFFPVFSYKPWFVGWSVRIASPIWSGSLAVIAGVLVTLAEKQWTSRYLWEAAFTFSIFTLISSPVQGAIAVASLLLGPYCYYSFAGVSGTNYLSYAISSFFPYGKFASSCKDPLHYEWYHLALQLLDFISGLVILSASLAIAVKLTARLFQFGHFNNRRLDLKASKVPSNSDLNMECNHEDVIDQDQHIPRHNLTSGKKIQSSISRPWQFPGSKE